jgi:membrane protein YqaA with SNARE-associated domain
VAPGDPSAEPIQSVVVATSGNTLGALTTYAVGIYGGTFLMRKVLRVDDETREKAQQFYVRYGSWTLLFSWLPFIGDPLCLVGGLLKINFWRFFLLVAEGKLFRYGVVAAVMMKIAEGG